MQVMASNVVEIRSTSASFQSVAKWKVKVGATVQANSLLAQLQSGGGTTSLKSTHFGKVTKLCVEEGGKIEMGSVLCEIELCSHPIQLREMCAVCGADLRLLDTASVANLKRSNSSNNDQKQSTAIAIVHSRPDLLVDTSTGIELGRRERAELLVRRKLVLLVDLDQTLVHTTHENVPADLPGVVHYQTAGSSHLHNAGSSASMWYHTKIRPGTPTFLERLAQRYELHIFTMGSRAYAHAVADALDASHKLFARRILSRDECLDAFRKTANLRALFPSGDQLVAIIDDRDEVWSFAPNLVQVRPFVTPFDHLVEDDAESDSPEAVYLDRLGTILERVHSAFYEEFDRRTASTLPPPPPTDKRVDLEAQVSRVTKLEESAIPDLKLVVPSLKGAVLRGTAVVFSCVHPRNVDAQRCFTHRVATQLGASVFADLHVALKTVRRSVTRCRSSSKLSGSGNEEVAASSSASETLDAQEETLNEVMLVCGKYGSSKQHEAKSLRDERVHIVTVEWLYETYYAWQRQPPEAFPVSHDYDLARYCEMPEPFYVRNWQLRLERLRERRAKQEMQESIEEDAQEEAEADTKVKNDSDAIVDVKTAAEVAADTSDEPKLDTARRNESRSRVQLTTDAASNRLNANRERRRHAANTKGGPPNKRQTFQSVNPLPHFSDDQLAEMEREIDEALDEDDADDEETASPAAQRPLAPPINAPDDDAPMYGENEDVPLGWTVDEFERVGRSRASRKQRWRVTVANGEELKLGDTTTEDDDPDGALASARKRREGRATDDELNDESRLDAGVRLLMNADNVMGDYACLTRMRSGVLENENEDEEHQPDDEEDDACDQNACNAQLDGHYSV